MEYAINKTTKKRISAIETKLLPEYQNLQTEDVWLLDPKDIESYDPKKCPDINNVKVSFRDETTYINFKGTKVVRSPHFMIPNRKKLGINVLPESPEHKAAKNLIYTILKENQLELAYNKINKPKPRVDVIKIKDLEFDYSTISIEVRARDRTTRIADVMVAFKQRHSLLGAGIVFEIQLSKQTEKREDRRTYDWARKDYSVVWLKSEDFESQENEEDEEILLELKTKIVEIRTAVSLQEDVKNILKEEHKNARNQMYAISEKFKKELREVYNQESRTAREDILTEHKEIIGDYNEIRHQIEYIEEMATIARQGETKTVVFQDPLCPRCGRHLKVRSGRDGSLFWGCEGWRMNNQGCNFSHPYEVTYK